MSPVRAKTALAHASGWFATISASEDALAHASGWFATISASEDAPRSRFGLVWSVRSLDSQECALELSIACCLPPAHSLFAHGARWSAVGLDSGLLGVRVAAQVPD